MFQIIMVGVDVYRTFNVGALDDDQVSNGDGTYYENKGI